MRRLGIGSPAAQRPLILMYHRIAAPVRDPWGLAVSPERFEAQLVVLKDRRRVLPLRLFAQLHRERRLPGNAVAITFDDGYACNASVAAPLLAKHRLPATFFLATGAIGHAREFWWDELARLIFESGACAFEVVIDGEKHAFVLGDKEDISEDFDAAKMPHTAREAAYLGLWQALKDRHAKEQERLLDALWDQYLGSVPPARASHRAMTVAEVQILAQSGSAEIGVHTVTHPALSRLDVERQKLEIETSKAAGERLAEAPVTSFAYPYGDLVDTTVGLVGGAGFDLACTTEPAPVTERSGHLRLPRMQVRNWDAQAFASALVAAGQRTHTDSSLRLATQTVFANGGSWVSSES